MSRTHIEIRLQGSLEASKSTRRGMEGRALRPEAESPSTAGLPSPGRCPQARRQNQRPIVPRFLMHRAITTRFQA